MNIFEAIISGIVQGITEFLPISSSGHLVILHRLMGLKTSQLSFDIFVHLGTLVAICVVFRRDIIEALTGNKRLGLLIIVGTIVTGVFVLLFNKNIENIFTNPKLVGAMLILTGFWLIFGSFVRFGTEGLTGFKAALIGLAQGIAALPGISRSGATISTGLFLGLDSYAAARFSFLLSIPAVIGAVILKVKVVTTIAINISNLIGLITSCLVGIVSLKLLLRILYKNRFHFFGVYCLIAGVLAILLL